MRKHGFAAILALAVVGLGNRGPGVIYGEDNRLDVYEVRDPQLAAISRSTVALVRKHQLRMSGQLYDMTTVGFGQSQNYCKDERFYSQPAGAFCSGFLVAPNLVVTAGHCINDADCASTAFVFDFVMENERIARTRFMGSQLYSCKKVIISRVDNSGSDFALVELDRPVHDRVPLALRRSGELPVGAEIALIGHPSGLPLKIAGGATVRSWAANKSFFVADTDSYGGNSGSAVVNLRTLEVEGILVRGDNDFTYDQQRRCYRSELCKYEECRGEDVTAIRYITLLLYQRRSR